MKAMIDDQGNQVKSAPPSTPVNVLGWSEVPDCGAICKGAKNERVARREAEEHADMEKKLLPVPRKFLLRKKVKLMMKLRIRRRRCFICSY